MATESRHNEGYFCIIQLLILFISSYSSLTSLWTLHGCFCSNCHYDMPTNNCQAHTAISAMVTKN